MDLTTIRGELDEIDHSLLDLFCRRLDLAREVAAAKAETGKAVFDPDRERAKLLDAARRAPERYESQVISLFSLLMSMNKAEQQRYLHSDDPEGLSNRVTGMLSPADEPFPQTATVACQGVEGAYSQIAACRAFHVPGIRYFKTFEATCRAVADGACEFGVLPIENSTAGSVNAVYDLLAKYRFQIVRSVRVKIDHNLLAKPGTAIGDVREIWSHEQAVAQCSDFIDRLGARVHIATNTAAAAEAVAKSDRTDVAALSSRSCADLYGLEVLGEDVQDSGNNYTRFVVVSAKPRIFAGATRTSLMLTLPHRPGSLYRVLERFYALDINMVKIESRPIPDRDFEFVFYFDLDCPVGSEALRTLLDSLDDICERYWFLGSYAEVM